VKKYVLNKWSNLIKYSYTTYILCFSCQGILFCPQMCNAQTTFSLTMCFTYYRNINRWRTRSLCWWLWLLLPVNCQENNSCYSRKLQWLLLTEAIVYKLSTALSTTSTVRQLQEDCADTCNGYVAVCTRADDGNTSVVACAESGKSEW